jgi:predicted ATPase
MIFAKNIPKISLFLVATVEEIYVSDDARYEITRSFKLIQNHLIETYEGYNLIEVPKDTVITDSFILDKFWAITALIRCKNIFLTSVNTKSKF